MRRFRDIIEDIRAPSVQDLWLNGGKLKYYAALRASHYNHKKKKKK